MTQHLVSGDAMGALTDSRESGEGLRVASESVPSDATRSDQAGRKTGQGTDKRGSEGRCGGPQYSVIDRGERPLVAARG